MAFCETDQAYHYRIFDRQYMSSESTLQAADRSLFAAAWKTAREHHGPRFTFYLPGMIRYGGLRGGYPAISLTGSRCELLCRHCRGKLLAPMIKTDGPPRLVRMARRLSAKGNHGLLLTGGADRDGNLPWNDYLPAIGTLKNETGLFLSAHTGFPDLRTCRRLKEAGVTQGLVDAIGDERTAREVYRLAGLERVWRSLQAIRQSGLELVPHIVAGLYYGNLRGEYRALEIIQEFEPAALVIIALTPLEGTPMAGIAPPGSLAIARLIARARLLMPAVPISLGCERPRDRRGWELEKLAIRAGATRMAVWSETAVEEARARGLQPRFQATCCSLTYNQNFALPSS